MNPNKTKRKLQRRDKILIVVAIVAVIVIGSFSDKNKTTEPVAPAHTELDAGQDIHETLYHEVEVENRKILDEELIALAKKVMKKNPDRPIQMGVYGPGDWKDYGYTVAIVNAKAGGKPEITSRNSRDFDSYPPEDDIQKYWDILKRMNSMYERDTDGTLTDEAVYEQISSDYNMTPDEINSFMNEIQNFVSLVE